MFSIKAHEQRGLGWHRGGHNICYFRNSIKKKGGQKLHTLTISLEAEYDRDTVFLAHCFPYTYTGERRCRPLPRLVRSFPLATTLQISSCISEAWRSGRSRTVTCAGSRSARRWLATAATSSSSPTTWARTWARCPRSSARWSS